MWGDEALFYGVLLGNEEKMRNGFRGFLEQIMHSHLVVFWEARQLQRDNPGQTAAILVEENDGGRGGRLRSQFFPFSMVLIHINKIYL